MGPSLCKMCFLPCTTRCELVPGMIGIVKVDFSKKTRSYRPLEDYEAINVAVGCYVRYASAVEDTPRGTPLIMGRSCAESDTWVNPRERARLPMARSGSG